MIRFRLAARWRKVNRIGAEALAGRRGVAGMILGYSALAVVLLLYVSMQVYTGSLLEDIEKQRRKQEKLQEMIGLQTMQWASLSSRKNVIEICEQELGLVRADSEDLVRVAVKRYREYEDYTLDEPVGVRELLREAHQELSEVGQK
jgi:hypothetical protein